MMMSSGKARTRVSYRTVCKVRCNAETKEPRRPSQFPNSSGEATVGNDPEVSGLDLSGGRSPR